MLLVLTILVVCILYLPLSFPPGFIPSSTTARIDTVRIDSARVKLIVTSRIDTSFTMAQAKDLLKDWFEFRKTILAVILTAFGAWIGAGAAYFFGRENQRETADTLLKMRQVSPKERLSQVLVGDFPLKKIDWTVKQETKIREVIDVLRKEPDRWFIPIVDNQGVLVNIIHREAVWPVVFQEPDKKELRETGTIGDFLTAIAADKFSNLKNKMGIYVTANPKKSIGEIHDQMLDKDIFICVVTDEQGRPAGYFDTADVRKLLLRAN